MVQRPLGNHHDGPDTLLVTPDTADTAQTEPVTEETEATEALRELITPVRFVLWDLDGPICRLFSGHPAHQVARDLVELIDRRGLGGLLTERERSTADPQVVLLGLGRRHPSSDLIIDVEKWLTQQELTAAPKAYPTTWADPLIRTWSRRARFAITTNNSALAASRYIATRGLADCFPYIYGRTRDLDRMKPHPHTLRLALNAMGAEPSRALMLGDAPTDFEAARDAGVPFLGYACTEGKLKALLDVGVPLAHTVNSLKPVLDVLRTQLPDQA
ncbi:HAD-IA family hydrolase [Streptomyces sp. MNU76]|uniref:HAD family hydrolase n=1 Tax=Streptomyces sp. MNU76 TaxID=2560026 RepID=UPI001E4F9811|nr:HAD-IA family hydrolase [Streptomyces sp. MNU76]MCC9710576.1 HAD-IA family hydrolase [Streptomyces sp. MNU76]